MSAGPMAVGFWAKLLCGLGLHRREFAFGYATHLDASRPDGYYGTIFCGRCGLVLSGGPTPPHQEKP